MPGWQRLLHTARYVLYGCSLRALIGWANSSAAVPTCFGFWQLPICACEQGLGEAIKLGPYTRLPWRVVVLQVAAALKHHIVDRDGCWHACPGREPHHERFRSCSRQRRKALRGVKLAGRSEPRQSHAPRAARGAGYPDRPPIFLGTGFRMKLTYPGRAALGIAASVPVRAGRAWSRSKRSAVHRPADGRAAGGPFQEVQRSGSV